MDCRGKILEHYKTACCGFTLGCKDCPFKKDLNGCSGITLKDIPIIRTHTPRETQAYESCVKKFGDEVFNVFEIPPQEVE